MDDKLKNKKKGGCLIIQYNKIDRRMCTYPLYRNNVQLFYKVPKITNKTDKGRWLNAYAQKFFSGGWKFDNQFKKLGFKLKTTTFRLNNSSGVLVKFFKNLKKLNKENFVGEVFNVEILTTKLTGMAKDTTNHEEAA